MDDRARELVQHVRHIGHKRGTDELALPDAVLAQDIHERACRQVHKELVETRGACLMVGDSEVKDIQPAVGLGMRAIRLAIEAPPPASSAAHAVVTSLSQAGSILTEWAAPAAV